MAKLPSRIPASQASTALGWKPPEIQQSTDSKTIKLLSRTPPPRMSLSKSQRNKPNTDDQHVSDETNDAGVNAGSTSAANHPDTPAADPSGSAATPDQQPDPHSELVESAATPETNPEPIAPVKTEAEGYADGFKKGETEGFVAGEKAGFEAGQAAGTETGRTQAEAAFNKSVAEQKTAITTLQQAFLEPPNIDAELQQELVTLITELTKTVIGVELKSTPELIQNLVAQALAALPHGADKPRVFVNPTDIELLQSVSHPDVEFLPDAGLARGGCRVVAGQSSVEAGVALRIREALLATCRDEAVPEISEVDMQTLETELSTAAEVQSADASDLDSNHTSTQELPNSDTE